MKLSHFSVTKKRSPVDNMFRAFAKASSLDLGFSTKEEIKAKKKINALHWVPLGSFKNRKLAYEYIDSLKTDSVTVAQ
tara:strand:+ start:2772 stop:3005 length:234 start_codon:yes stop_codon:yes gene_type:complete